MINRQVRVKYLFLLGKKKDFAALNTKFVRMKAHLPLISWMGEEIQRWLFQQKVITLQIKP